MVGILVNNSDGLNGGGLLTKIERENRKSVRQISNGGVRVVQQQHSETISAKDIPPYHEYVTPKG